ncbi:MAG: GntR family transcriptional regulator [Burkholderiales bacterium]|nr:GntR family transcriptional regulator [Burkholderiales bacterium]
MVNPSSTKKTSAVPPIAINRVALHDEVTLRLRNMIVEGQLAAGARIQELELAQLLGVSRTPIREAIKVLASEGLVDMQPLKGAVVKQFSDKDAQDMLKVIAALESFAAKQAKVASQNAIDKVLALHKKMQLQYTRKNRLEYFSLNQQIHDSLIALTGNDTLIALHAILSKRMRRIRYTGNTLQTNWDEAMQEHDAMMEALASKDFNKLAKIMEQHILNTWPRLKRL